MKMVLQRADGDCGIAALAMLLDLSYEDLYLAASKVDRSRRGKSGMRLNEMVAVANVLGIKMGRKRPNLDCDEGVLFVRWNRRRRDPWHFVVLTSGIIVDPADGTFDSADEYLVEHGAKADTLLVVK